MHQLQRSWVRSQHPSAQWNLRGGRWSSAEYCTNKKKKSPQKIFKQSHFTLPQVSHIIAEIRNKIRFNIQYFTRHFNGCARMQRQHTRCWRTWTERWILVTISTILPAADSSVESSFPMTDPPGNGRLKRIIPATYRPGTRRLKK